MNISGAMRRISVGIPIFFSACVVPIAMLGSPSSAATAAPTGSAAVFTPLLQLFDFGAVVGLPLGCGAMVGVGAAASSAANLADEASPFLGEVSSECIALSQQGNMYLQQAITEFSSLTIINPAFDPVIASLATVPGDIGNTYGASLSPFGPTIAGLGSAVAFFEGSS